MKRLEGEKLTQVMRVLCTPWRLLDFIYKAGEPQSDFEQISRVQWKLSCRWEDLRQGDRLGDNWINSGETCQGTEQRQWQWGYI